MERISAELWPGVSAGQEDPCRTFLSFIIQSEDEVWLKVRLKEWAISARLCEFAIARGSLRPLHFLGGWNLEDTYENSRVSGQRDSA
jgi:hypothetical protein